MRPTGVGNTTVSSQQLEHQLDGCDPISCILYSHSPSIQVYYALRSRLENSSEAWLQEFVSLDGLDSLLDSLGHMIGSKYSGFTDAILQIDCLSCIRAVLNSRVGMDTIVNSTDGIYKLLKGFDLANTLPRKHVVEILSAICVYNKLAYRRLLDALDQYKKSRHLYHRFSFVVNELKAAETLPHKTAVLTFINAIINSTGDRFQRCRIRNEFIGLSLLDVLSFLQREDTDEDLYTQLQTFIEKKHEDETSVDINSNLDLSSPQDLADAIQSRVFGGSKMVSFVNILQDLLAIEIHEKEKSDILWQLLERHTHHLVHGCSDATSLSEMDTEQACQALVTADLASSPKVIAEKKITPVEITKMTNQNSSSLKKESFGLKAYSDSGYMGCEDKLSPPSYTADNGTTFNFGTISPMTHLISNKQLQDVGKQLTFHNKKNKENVGSAENIHRISMYDNSSPLKLPPRYAGPSPRKRKACGIINSPIAQDLKKDTKAVLTMKRAPSRQSSLNTLQKDVEKSPVDKCTRVNYYNYQRNKIAYPAYDMKNLKWIKLDEPDIAKFAHCIWLNCDVSKLKLQPDFQQVEEVFKEKVSKNDILETSLLSNATRLSFNLFLNRLEEEPIALVQKLSTGDTAWLPLPLIKYLMDILPDHDEIKHLKYYNGNLLELGQAEQFLLHLLDLPNYRILLMGQLRRAEFTVMTSQLNQVLTSMLETSRSLLVSEGLKEMFMLILRLGNFLNHGQYNGYASGFKLGSLSRLADVKTSEPGHNLVHFMVSLVDSTDEQLLTFLNEIPRLEKAASYSPSQIKADFDKMNSEINTFVRLLVNASPSIRKDFDAFLEEVKCTFRDLQGHISELKLQTHRLAEYFCELETFDIQYCFTTLLNFFKQLRQCRQEVQLMRKQKSIAEKHNDQFNQKLRNKHLALKFGLDAAASSSMVEERKPMVETLLTELHHGNFKPTLIQSSHPSALSAKNSPKTTPKKSCTTPERDLNQMDLSGITLMGTPMINRPSSEMYDADLTITAISTAPKIVTSSVKNLHSAPLTLYSRLQREPPAVPTKVNTVRTHHRSRSDLADSINVTQKWIRYQEQAQQDHLLVPLAQPESSMMLATLNLEAGCRKFPYQQPISLVAGPTIALPQCPDHSTDDEDLGTGQFVRNGKRGERKSGTLSNFFNKIAKALKQKNSEQKSPANGNLHGEDGALKGLSKVNNGNTPSSLYPVMKISDKENVHPENGGQNMVFEKQRKHPARLSNRFRGKSAK
ncbi:inverted formin-2 [Biomphalaria glabrata]|nr:inverted formin-2-like [Biomphalaria glabrata]